MWKTMIAGVGVVAALALTGPALAADRIVDATSIAGVANLLQEAGYRAEIKKGDDFSYIVSATNGEKFEIVFFGCTDDRMCDSFEFFSFYEKDPLFSVDLVNEWNMNERFLKVVLDKEGNLLEFLDVSVIGGMTFANFKDYIDWFDVLNARLDEFIEKKRAAAGAVQSAPPEAAMS